jgi:Flp pilus assembly protein TadG
LSAAVDSAAIAAARGLTVGTSDALRIANAKAAAQKFFNGNFPPNYLGVTSTTLTIPDPVHNSNGYWDVTASATANMPTTFMRVLNWNQVNVDALGQVIRRDLDMVLVLDTSGSLSSVFSTVQSAAVKFIGKFIPTTDRVGLVAFSSGANVLVPIDKTSTRGFNSNTIKTAINNLNNGGATASAEGMRRALNEINTVPAAWRSSLRVIVFFSDGAPNEIPATFTRTSGSPNQVTGDLYSETSATGSGVTPAPGCGNGVPCGVWPNIQVYPYNNANNGNVSNTSNIAQLPNNSGTTLTLTSTVSGDAGNPTAVSIPLAGKRTLTGSPYANSRCNVNMAARNMLENVANSARSQDQPIAIYSLGLGAALNTLEITFCGYATTASIAGTCPSPTSFPEFGCNIMKRLANTADSDTHQPAPQPTGLYCYADITADPNALNSCFDAIASDILRLTK